MKKDTFGLNMKKYCREHEAYIESQPPSQELLSLHLRKLSWLQHERLIHLIVTVMVIIVELFVLDLVLVHPEFGIYPAVILLGLAVLLGFYFFHYFFLENTVQHWYALADEIQRGLPGE